MSLDYPLAFPSETFTEAELIEENVTAVIESPFTLAGQAQEFGGGRWRMRFAVPSRSGADGAAWQAFRSKLYGQAGTFLAGNPLRVSPRGSVAGSPVVAANHPSGKSLSVSGFTPSASNVLLADDYFQIGSGAYARLYKNLTDVSADGSGNATLDIWPRWRVATSGAAERLTNGNVEAWDDVNTPTGWTKVNSANGTYTQQTGHAGNYAVRITTTAGLYIALRQTKTGFTRGAPECLRLWAKSASGTQSANALVYNATVGKGWDRTASKWLASYNAWTTQVGTSWTEIVLPFFIDPTFGASDNYQIEIFPGASAGNAIDFDDISLVGPSFAKHPLITTSPRGVFRLAGSDLQTSLLRPFRFSGVTVDAVEVL